MRTSFFAAASCAALLAAVAAPAVAAPALALPAPTLAVVASDAITDEELRRFAAAMATIEPIASAVTGGTPTAEQQAAMAAAIEASGLALERFNVISTAVSTDPVVRARVALATTEPSPAGSAAAGVTDTEVEQFVVAMAAVQPIAESLNGSAPNAEQQAQMVAAITSAGLALDRFNDISSAVSQDAHLRARLALADARRAG